MAVRLKMPTYGIDEMPMLRKHSINFRTYDEYRESLRKFTYKHLVFTHVTLYEANVRDKIMYPVFARALQDALYELYAKELGIHEQKIMQLPYKPLPQEEDRDHIYGDILMQQMDESANEDWEMQQQPTEPPTEPPTDSLTLDAKAKREMDKELFGDLSDEDDLFDEEISTVWEQGGQKSVFGDF